MKEIDPSNKTVIDILKFFRIFNLAGVGIEAYPLLENTFVQLTDVNTESLLTSQEAAYAGAMAISMLGVAALTDRIIYYLESNKKPRI